MLTSQPVMHIVPDYNPFNRQYKVHPLKAEVEKKALDFMERYRLYWTEEQRQRLYGQDCGGLQAMSIPWPPMPSNCNWEPIWR